MHLDIIWNGATTPVDLVDGSVTVGGGPKDDIRLEGLPFKLLTLEVDGPRLSIRAVRPVRVGKQLFPAHVARLVLPGEALTLPNDVVVKRPDDEASRERRKNKSTDFVMKELLTKDPSELESRAATLTCVAGADEGHVYPLAFLDTSLGRGDDADVRLHDRTVSRQHARLLHRGLSWFIEELTTTNGVYVNGVRVKSARSLDHGDVLELGHTMLRFDEGERAPEERTRIEKLPLPPAEAAQPPAAPAPPSVTVQPTDSNSGAESTGSAVTEPLPGRRAGLGKTDLAIVVIGALLVLSGLSTAVLFLR
ncbi:MAG: FHA domain-containing protein [Myxococcaceae bacterium]|nr:FHA domain-containing protein [Myxococcaceae bacterium]